MCTMKNMKIFCVSPFTSDIKGRYNSFIEKVLEVHDNAVMKFKIWVISTK